MLMGIILIMLIILKIKTDNDNNFRPVGWVKRFVFPHVTKNNPNLSHEEPIRY